MIPAFTTTISSPPPNFLALSKNSDTLSSSTTSTLENPASKPLSLIIFSVSFEPSPLDPTQTLAPASASLIAIYLPTPLLAPIIAAVLPDKLIS